jgi:uncharacterized iron-regulated membrane protein
LVRLLIAPAAELPADFDQRQLATELDRIAQTVAPERLARIKAPNAEEPYWTLTDTAGDEQLRAIGSLTPYTDNLWLLKSLAIIRALHTELLTGLIGETLLLASGLAGLFLSITGLILWWPSRRSFHWRWVLPRRLPARQLRVSHLHVGAVMAGIVLLVTLTGAVMLWQKIVGPLLPPVAVSALPEKLEPAPTAAPSQWLRGASAVVADGWPTYIRLPTEADAQANIRFRLPGEWHSNGRTSVTFDTTTGAGTVSSRSDQAPPARKLLNQMYPLHSGYGMGGVYAALVFVSGIAMLWLALTGGLSYLRRRRS